MSKHTKALPHLSADEVMNRIKQTKGFRGVQRWLVIWNALVLPRSAKEIGASTGLAEGTVHNIISGYNRKGVKAMEGPGRGGRRRAYLDLEEEKYLLKGFEDKTVIGQVATVKDIKKTMEKKIGHKVHKSTVYRMLNRHNWRKIVPRPSHIKKDKEKQDEFKKNFQKRLEKL